MTDMLLDDVKALLDKDFGDDRILRQICRACERNEVISNYERNYVRKLAEKHLGRKPEFPPTPAAVTEEKPQPPYNVVIPKVQPLQQTQSYTSHEPRTSYFKRKNKKIMSVMGSVALAIIIVAYVSFSGVDDGTGVGNDITDVTSTLLSVETDSTFYAKKDLISISGASDTTGAVNLSIENQNGELIWSEKISLKSNGKFSTLTIAGGKGWDNSGIYTIKVDNGNKIKSNTFSFTA